MENKIINAKKLSGAMKDYFKALISKGKNVVDVNEVNVDIHKMLAMLPAETAIEWNSVGKVGLPLVSDEYLVMICGAEKPTVLHYDVDEQVFFHEEMGDTVFYKVTHWAEMPGGPDV